MTVSDLIFIVSFLVLAGSACRIAYLLVRGYRTHAARVAARLAMFVLIYFTALIACSAVEGARHVAIGEPQCSDDFCIVVDSAERLSTLGPVAAHGDFVVVSGRVISRAARRPQRETDITGLLRTESGTYLDTSGAGESALRSLNLAGNRLTDFVEPNGANDFALAYDVPKASRRFDFVVRHSAFPRALIVGDPESLFHRRTSVPLSVPRSPL